MPSNVEKLVPNQARRPSLVCENEALDSEKYIVRRLDQLHKILDGTSVDVKNTRVFEKKKIGAYLMDEGLIQQDQLEHALMLQVNRPGKRLGEILEELGVISSKVMHIAIAQKLGLPYVNLREFDVDVQALSSIPVGVSQKYNLFPICYHRGHLVISMCDPTNIESFEVVRFLSGQGVEVCVSPREDILWAINRYYEAEDAQKAVEELGLQQLDIDPEEDPEKLAQGRPIVRLVSNIIADAIEFNASDIHIRPLENTIDLFFRMNGTMTRIRSFSKGLLPAIASRIKVIANMNVAERRLPQDGRARHVHKNITVDLRVSAIPTTKGESIVIRVLNANSGVKPLTQLGFSKGDLQKINTLLHKSHGMFLVTGPTGSGKSTSLYAALQGVQQLNSNIITVEEPVEYNIDGVEQIEVNSQIGYTFAKALRHILRHDPDTIMIGEIRDSETANIAVESALTGHMVLSTLHTNSAADTITRLLDMGVEHYLLNSTLNGVLAQRLVRLNCHNCMQVEEVDPAIRQNLGIGPNEKFFTGTGCPSCHHTGFEGRITTYELLTISDNMRRLISSGNCPQKIHQLAVKEGMVPLTQHAIELARQHKISLAEAYRVRLQ